MTPERRERDNPSERGGAFHLGLAKGGDCSSVSRGVHHGSDSKRRHPSRLSLTVATLVLLFAGPINILCVPSSLPLCAGKGSEERGEDWSGEELSARSVGEGG
jgi:hypothetical protein